MKFFQKLFPPSSNAFHNAGLCENYGLRGSNDIHRKTKLRSAKSLHTVKPRLSELRLSEHSIIRTLRFGPRIIALIYKQPRLSELLIIRTFLPGPNVFG